MFSANSIPAFGAASAPSAFGATAPAFGATAPAFGAASAPAFGAAGAFGASSVSAFGATAPAFGAGFGASSAAGAFGSAAGAFGSAAGAFGTAAGAFGSSAGAFGATGLGAFGATGLGAFGATGAGAFGATGAGAFGATAAGAFGATAGFGAASAPPAFGAGLGGAFGSASTSAFGSTFGAAGGLFGASSAPMLGAGLGAQPYGGPMGALQLQAGAFASMVGQGADAAQMELDTIEQAYREHNQNQHPYAPGTLTPNPQYRFQHLFFQKVLKNDPLRMQQPPAGVDHARWREALENVGGQDNPDELWPVPVKGVQYLARCLKARARRAYRGCQGCSTSPAARKPAPGAHTAAVRGAVARPLPESPRLARIPRLSGVQYLARGLKARARRAYRGCQGQYFSPAARKPGTRTRMPRDCQGAITSPAA
ncbi:hypothetical protein CYMTET_32771 [Cymbomonas tetramitiformis]|uniref:Uncharacterized protein n=1 Tax=Cymbomonas tetramitiformis TaxID=36881 RepID=A0AAE0FED3_9CHLO|nr:hypothetical protein CYMTET_32771 [Cymbomonas tetramitiformis]